MLLTTFRKDGTPVGAPVSIAVEGERGVIRSFERAGKAKRLRNTSAVEVAPSTARGVPTGTALRARARPLTGPEWSHAAHLLRRKYPLLHGVVVPSSHHLMRRRFGRTVHYELTPLEASSGEDRAT